MVCNKRFAVRQVSINTVSTGGSSNTFSKAFCASADMLSARNNKYTLHPPSWDCIYASLRIARIVSTLNERGVRPPSAK